MIAKNANDVHLDVDAVLLGELAFAPFDRIYYGTVDLGPKSLWVIGTILLVTLILLFAFFKELKMSTFDAGLATSLGDRKSTRLNSTHVRISYAVFCLK